MVLLGVTLSLTALVLWVYCLFDAVTTPAEACRTLPKPVWVLVVALFPILGSIGWLVLGRPREVRAAPWRPAGPGRGSYPPGPRGTGRGGQAPLGPDDDPDFIRGLERRRLDPGSTPDED